MNERPLAEDDLEAVAAMAAEDEAAQYGRPSCLDAAGVRDWMWRVDLERDSWLFEEDRHVVAAGWFAVWDTEGAFGGIVAQGWKGRGLGSEILARAEERGLERAVAKLQGFGYEADAAAAALFRGRGYTDARRFYEMAIDLTAAPEMPPLPSGLELHPFREDDARAFHAAMAEAFRDNWDWMPIPYDEWWEMRRDQYEDDQGPLWFVVRDGSELAAAIRNEASRNGGGYVGALGVRDSWRGRGLAKALLLHTFADFHRRGETHVALGVDAENATGAAHLYERVGMEVESCTVVYEKVLR